MRLLRVLPRADADIDEAADYYADHAGLEVGLRFLGAVQDAYNFICENPDAGPPGHYQNQRLLGLRRWPLPGFENYLVFYRLADGWVKIVRVLHGARDIEGLLRVEEWVWLVGRGQSVGESLSIRRSIHHVERKAAPFLLSTMARNRVMLTERLSRFLWAFSRITVDELDANSGASYRRDWFNGSTARQTYSLSDL